MPVDTHRARKTMNLLPKSRTEFGDTQYWNKFFKQRGKKAFDWWVNNTIDWRNPTDNPPFEHPEMILGSILKTLLAQLIGQVLS